MDEVTTMRGMEKVPQSLGPRLRIARENAGLTKVELARRMGVMVGTVEAWEKDKRMPRANRMVTLAGILSVSLSWLLEGRESEYMESQGAATIDTLQAELERLTTTLGEARAIVERSRERLEEISHRIEEGDVAGL